MVAGGGTGKSGKKHYYYVCKRKNKGECEKSREGKDNLEKRVTQQVYDFLSDKKNAEKAARETIAYYERRTDDDGIKSIETRIRQAQTQVDDLTNAFIEAKSPLLRANIERKMTDYEKLLADLQATKSRILLERGHSFTVKDILEFIAELLKGNPADKEHQKQIIDNLVYKVFVADDYINPLLTIGNGKEIENVRLSEVKEVLDKLYGASVQTQLPLARQLKPKSNISV